MNHTKGEWKVGLDSWDTYIGTGNQYLAKMINSGSLTDAEVKANANLIASAPDMYEALKEILFYNIEMPSTIIEQIQKALAKAEGRIEEVA